LFSFLTAARILVALLAPTSNSVKSASSIVLLLFGTGCVSGRSQSHGYVCVRREVTASRTYQWYGEVQ
jgi:hypothetical protein